MNVGQLEAAYRVQTGDTVAAKYLCSRADFLLRLNEAQVEAARRSHMLIDSSTPELTEVTVSAGQAVVELDPRIIRVRRACRLPQRWPLEKTSARTLDRCLPGWEAAANSTPSRFVTDWQSGALRLYPPPVAAVTLALTVIREPLDSLSDNTHEPELPARCHLSLLEWVKYRTYSAQDPDNFDSVAAEKALATFTAEFGPVIGAINEHWSSEQDWDNGEF